MKSFAIQVMGLVLVGLAGTAAAKLPPPGDEAKAKAAEAAAKSAHAGKVANYQLCKVQDKVAAAYMAQAKKSGAATKAAVATAPCEDPGPMAAAPMAAAPAKKP